MSLTSLSAPCLTERNVTMSVRSPRVKVNRPTTLLRVDNGLSPLSSDIVLSGMKRLGQIFDMRRTPDDMCCMVKLR